jgi:hypothetical protein
MFEHDADNNPNWTPRLAWRVYACAQCGAETKIQTNHTGTVWAQHCVGKCRKILNPHTENERVLPYQGPHKFVCEIM